MKLTGKLLIIPVTALVFLGAVILQSSIGMNSAASLFKKLADHEVQSLITTAKLQQKMNRLSAIPGEVIVKVMMGESGESTGPILAEGTTLLQELTTTLPTVYSDSTKAIKTVDSIYTEISTACSSGDSYGASEKMAAFSSSISVLTHQLDTLVAQRDSSVQQASKQSVRTVESLNSGILATGGIAVILLILMSLIMSKKIVGSLKKVTRFISNKLTEDDFSQTLPAQGNDEIGEFVGWLNRFISHMNDILSLLKSRSSQLKTSAVALKDIAGTAEDSLDEMDHHNQDALITVQTLTKNMDSALNTAKTLSREVSGIADAALDAKEHADAVVDESNRTASLIQTTRDRTEENGAIIERLSTVVSEVGKSISAIKTIADTTQMLAVNASVEAARAGKAGDGFAVVAQEVRNLATQSGKIVREIGIAFSEVSEVTEAIQAGFTETLAVVSELDELRISIEDNTVVQLKQISGIADLSQSLTQSSADLNATLHSSFGSTKSIDSSTRMIAEESGRMTEAGHLLFGESEIISNLSEEMKKFTDRFSV